MRELLSQPGAASDPWVLRSALSYLESAASEESQFGDCPSYRQAIVLLKALIESVEQADKEMMDGAAEALDSLTENTDDSGEMVDEGEGRVISFRGAVKRIVCNIPATRARDLYGRCTTFRSQTAWRAEDLAELMAQ